MTINKIDILFNKLDEVQCYLLGYIFNNALIINSENLNEYYLQINIDNYSSNHKEIVLRLINYLLNDKWEYKNNKIILKSTKLCQNYFKLLNIDKELSNDNKEQVYNFPNLSQNDNILFWSFIRGFFEKNGNIIYNKNIPKCVISFYNYSFMNDYLCYLNIPYSKQINLFDFENDLTIEFISTNCVDFLGLIYKNNTIYKNKFKIYNEEMYNKFQTIINWKFIIQNSLNSFNIYIDINNK